MSATSSLSSRCPPALCRVVVLLINLPRARMEEPAGPASGGGDLNAMKTGTGEEQPPAPPHRPWKRAAPDTRGSAAGREGVGALPPRRRAPSRRRSTRPGAPQARLLHEPEREESARSHRLCPLQKGGRLLRAATPPARPLLRATAGSSSCSAGAGKGEGEGGPEEEDAGARLVAAGLGSSAVQQIGAPEEKREGGALGERSGGREGVGGVIEGVRLTCGPMSGWLG
jgi:hypothetical protein